MVVDAARRALGVEDEWSRTAARGFEWWPHFLAQRIWSETASPDTPGVFRVNAETDFLLCPSLPRSKREQLEDFLREASLSALIRDKRRGNLVWRCSIVVGRHNVGWARATFGIAAALQACVAHKQAELVGELVGLRPAAGEHPVTGVRPRPHAVIDIDDDLAESGGEATLFGPSDIQEADAAVAPAAAHSVSGPTGITAALTFDDDSETTTGKSALLIVETADPHPHFGPGAMLQLQLPPGITLHGQPIPPMSLNLREARTHTGAHLLGSWHAGDGPTFVSFVPNALAYPGVLSSLVVSMIARARSTKSAIDRQNEAGAESDTPAAEPTTEGTGTTDSPDRSGALETEAAYSGDGKDELRRTAGN